jgi:hypothetical protein
MSIVTPTGFEPSMPSTTSVGEAALAWAQNELLRGVREIGGNNRGPDVNAYLANVNLPPGEPWCCAFAVMGIQEGAGKLGVPCTIPVTGACLHLWSRSVNNAIGGMPLPGDIYVLQHSASTGHVGFVETVSADGFDVETEISGNTFADHGGRNGDCVALHLGSPEKTHGGKLLGYLRF